MDRERRTGVKGGIREKKRRRGGEEQKDRERRMGAVGKAGSKGEYPLC